MGSPLTPAAGKGKQTLLKNSVFIFLLTFRAAKTNKILCNAAHVGVGRYGTARVGILTIIDEEFAAVRAALGGASEVLEIEDTSYYSPNLRVGAEPDIVLTQSADRSNVPAAGAGRNLIEDFRPEVVVVCGIAGGIAGRDEIDLGHVVVADYIHYTDFRKLSEKVDSTRHYAYDQPTSDLISRHSRPQCRDLDLDAETPCQAPECSESKIWPPKVHHGPIIAAEKILGDPTHPEQRNAAARFDNALAVDMESVGVARAVHELRTDVTYNPRLAIVRGISDIVQAANPGTEEREEDVKPQEQDNAAQRARWKAYAAAAAALHACNVAQRLVRQPDPRASVRGAAAEEVLASQ